MKSFSWLILLSAFVPEEGQDATHAEIEALHEDLLRGQFSLFPVSINTPFWRSPRSKGLQACQNLQSLFTSTVDTGKCPFSHSNDGEGQDIANHLLLFTSSLAAKALASFLTAVLLNVYVFHENGVSLSAKIQALEDADKRSKYIRSIIYETERLSPPVVGIMRHTSRDIVIASRDDVTPSTLVPTAWDIWLYFVGAGRDSAEFGKTAEKFVFDRYLKTESTQPEGFAFGSGPKTCLGKDLMRIVASELVETCLGQNSKIGKDNTSDRSVITFHSDQDALPSGTQSWLGWKSGIEPEAWARDMKQLPTQRPRKPVLVKLDHQLTS
ncbi:MAG: hypothetical protein L6R41_002068 [Letrouitia leprolyta]|nr:MAG: hypothetical protein L6R41_002068 [Letrouitia leprolyta]